MICSMLKNKMRFLLAWVLALTLTAGTLAGCSGSNSGQSSSAGAKSEASSTASSGSSQADSKADSASATREVTDMAGRTVKLPAEIKSIATFGSIGVINAFVELMGSGDKICNEMTDSFTKSYKWAMQYEFAPQIKGAPVLQNADGEIQMEKVLELNPDLCLVMTKDLIEPLEKNGMNVIYFEWKQTEDVKTAVTLMGEALNKQDLAKDYLEYFDKMVAEAKEKTAKLTDADKKKVLYGNIDKLTQPHVIAEWWIDAAGGISVTKDSWNNEKGNCVYTQEDVLKWNPDVMLTTDTKMAATLAADALYSAVPAITGKAIYTIPTVAHVWGNRTVEQPLTIFWTMNKLYPDLESDQDLKDKISYFYDHFFNYKLTSEQLDKIVGNGV